MRQGDLEEQQRIDPAKLRNEAGEESMEKEGAGVALYRPSFAKAAARGAACGREAMDALFSDS
jgi:hypothetical protein